jgi:hypothetical protein
MRRLGALDPMRVGCRRRTRTTINENVAGGSSSGGSMKAVSAARAAVVQ